MTIYNDKIDSGFIIYFKTIKSKTHPMAHSVLFFIFCKWSLKPCIIFV